MRQLVLPAACMVCGFVGAALAWLLLPSPERARAETAIETPAPAPNKTSPPVEETPAAVECAVKSDGKAQLIKGLVIPERVAECAAPAEDAPKPASPSARGVPPAQAPVRRLDDIQDPALRKALSEPINLSFEECTLDDVIKRLRMELKINVLRAKGVEGDTVVTIDVGKVSGLLALDLIVDALDLQWVERDGAVFLVPNEP